MAREEYSSMKEGKFLKEVKQSTGISRVVSNSTKMKNMLENPTIYYQILKIIFTNVDE